MAEQSDEPRISDADARRVGDQLDVDWDVIPLSDWKKGLEVELEHGTKYEGFAQTNVTDDDLLKTGQIALAHFIEDPQYYRRLAKMEKEGDAYWEKHDKPSAVKVPVGGAVGGAPNASSGQFALILALIVLLVLMIVWVIAKTYQKMMGYGTPSGKYLLP